MADGRFPGEAEVHGYRDSTASVEDDPKETSIACYPFTPIQPKTPAAMTASATMSISHSLVSVRRTAQRQFGALFCLWRPKTVSRSAGKERQRPVCRH